MWWNKFIVLFALFAFLSGCKKVENSIIDQNNIPHSKVSFPFDEAREIHVISFVYKEYWDINQEANYKIIDGKIAFDEGIIKEKKRLSKEQQRELFKILNTEVCQETTVADCYTPEHRVLFYGKDNKLIAYLEICFQCRGWRVSDGWKTVELCDSNMSELKTLFKSAGIKHFTEY